MDGKNLTYHVRFIAKQSDMMGYTNYVFENLEFSDPDLKYIMCVRFPNWQQSPFEINDVGFVTVKYVMAGVDKWFDGTSFNNYKYTSVIFMKFIKENPEQSQEELLID